MMGPIDMKPGTRYSSKTLPVRRVGESLKIRLGQKSWYELATSVASVGGMLLWARVAVLTDTGTPVSCWVVFFSYVCDRGEVVFNVEGGRS